MKYKYIDKKIDYNGKQLKSLFAYLEHGLQGDSFVAFEGACDVSLENMVDGEDFLAKSKICGSHMLHFILEEFGPNLELAVCRQRLLAAIVFEKLSGYLKLKGLSSSTSLTRDGDDIFFNDGKLSISIATVSPVSSLIHFAVNVVNEGTPVKTSSLQDLGISTKAFADMISEAYILEVHSIKSACTKVHWVP